MEQSQHSTTVPPPQGWMIFCVHNVKSDHLILHFAAVRPTPEVPPVVPTTSVSAAPSGKACL